MSTILCTFPGKYGDSLWALPTMRAIAEATGAPVDLLTAASYASHLPLLREQPYLGRVEAWASWTPQDGAPMTPWSPFEESLHHQPRLVGQADGYDRVVHLGYREWPTAPLAQYVYAVAHREYPDLPLAPLDLDRPWITTAHPGYPFYARADVAVGFSDEWFELKYGILTLLQRAGVQEVWVGGAPRWCDEAGKPQVGLQEAAATLRQLPIALVCNSSLHVLACAVGTPHVLMVEPNPHRHNDVFFPYGKTGRETLILGGDGQPTFDARHVRDAVYAALQKAGR